MDDIDQQIAALSPAQRALFELRLKKRSASEAPEPAIPRRFNRDRASLSFAQQRLWFLDQLDPGNPFYNMSRAYRLRGNLDVGALERALTEILARHEVLRTRFESLDGEPEQVVEAGCAFRLPVLDLRVFPAAEREGRAAELTAEEVRRPFDLSHGPLVGGRLLRLGDLDYVLVLVTHHIVSDGWSSGIFINELAALYEAVLARRPALLPELQVQYGDFAEWQREWLRGAVLDRQLSYWRGRLGGALPVLDLPTDRVRPRVRKFDGARRSIALSGLLGGLNQLGQREGVTLYMTGLAAFSVLLSRYTGLEDIVVGSPIAGRNRAALEGLIGCFVNTLVLRTDLSGNPRFRELLARVREAALGAYAHQDLPFEKLVEELQPERDLSRNPLFEVMFALQNAPAAELALAGLTLTPWEIEKRTTLFDLEVHLLERFGGLTCTFVYSTELFDVETIARMMGHFQVLLEAVIENPDRCVRDLPLLTEAERHQLFVEWNGTKSDYPRGRCIHELFEAEVEGAPEAVAVEFEGEQLTYRELNGRANQLAHYLRGLGVGPEALVGLCVERSVEMVVALLGILKAGGAYVPLDPTYPRERLAFMLSDARVSVLLVQERLLASLPEQGAKLVRLDADWGEIEAQSGENLPALCRPENLAYVLYTSGSIGKPKGVEVCHAALVNYVTAVAKLFALSPADRLLQFSSISFDAAAEEIFATLCSGAALVLRDEAMVETVARFLSECARCRITVLDLPTAYWHELAAGPPPDAALPESLRLTVIGGERAMPERARRWLAASQGRVGFLNAYGPTETTISCTFADLSSWSDSNAPVPIGRPIANTRVYLLDRYGNPVPIGVAGELCVSGIGLARGYRNRPDLTAERFVPDPFSADPGARLYRTGDLARFRPDGNIEFLGRMDHQVKIRGFRIELGEIEAVLGQHPEVRESVVLAREDQPGEKRLVAYLVVDRGREPRLPELRSFLKQKLPEYMVPSAFVRMEALPLTPSGKLDRRALPVPEQTRPELEEKLVAPRTPVEEVLAGIWAQVLGVGQVGVHDNFFELGGHSLLATQVISRVRTTFQVELPLRLLFDRPTIAEFAGVIEETKSDGAKPRGAVLGPVVPVSREEHRMKRSAAGVLKEIGRT